MTRSSDSIELTLFSKPQLLITKSAEDFAALNAGLMEEISRAVSLSGSMSPMLLILFGRF